MSETLKPARGFIFVVPVDEIPSVNQAAGFSGKTEKFKLEIPYKLRVISVGGPVPYNENTWYEPEVKPGDIISHIQTNATLREKIANSGFLLDDQQILVMGFQDVVGIWKDRTEEC